MFNYFLVTFALAIMTISLYQEHFVLFIAWLLIFYINACNIARNSHIKELEIELNELIKELRTYER